MNLKIIKLTITQALVSVLSYFDRGLDGAVDAFIRADAKLDAYRTKLQAQMIREFDLQIASHDRQTAVRIAEEDRRTASYVRTDELMSKYDRAGAIQKRIGELLK